ncbi:hypothetical protein Cgig2_028029 [Carnegiea gigantea]|uniref:Uncharacterized protein n=1 Tax=Carnegiea gigantea TaxID=171969 RepID=A0A9Q1GZT3_9CARY|nr:hypothetical protein Cgig2_028029 [Carnegiea gigantea]
MVFPSMNILKHALFVYTVESFLMLEKAFIDDATYNYKEVESSTCYRVLHVCCVEQMPDHYTMKKWCKGIKNGQSLDLGKSSGKEPMVCGSVWKMQMMRKINLLIIASKRNRNLSAHCEKYFMELKELIEFDVGSIHCEEDGQGKNLNSFQNMLNPHGSRQNKRFNSIVEKQCDQGTIPSMSCHPTYYVDPSNSSSVFMPMMVLPVFQQLPTDKFLGNDAYNDKH